MTKGVIPGEVYMSKVVQIGGGPVQEIRHYKLVQSEQLGRPPREWRLANYDLVLAGDNITARLLHEDWVQKH